MTTDSHRMMPATKLSQVANALRSAKNVLVLTGAGVSAESNILRFAGRVVGGGRRIRRNWLPSLLSRETRILSGSGTTTAGDWSIWGLGCEAPPLRFVLQRTPVGEGQHRIAGTQTIFMESTELARLRRLAGKQTLLLTHIGRKTGKPHEVTSGLRSMTISSSSALQT
jgi:hypothetical protein